MTMKYYLHLNSWAGHTKTPVEIIKVTKKKATVRLLKDCIKAKRGSVMKVPRYALTFERETGAKRREE